ncbi:hypothetical protein EHS13_21030 [Paenibacillus psychroresistens]|uniref:Uncharacterized protein n=1 Tax=Paenibacillus psychroresistens TaxID=1778678 RepID=A0A6B8RME4_9BACL|nr:hypothetical protein [Paenibacillus psychroresistens]QGQ97189.1 hypothetical protein EHS13_21030 [Paenibacillus psychroresistens]
MTNNDIIKELYAIKDDLKNTEKCIDLFYKIQLTYGPLIEVITIMRFEKPKLYTYLKSRFDKNPRFNLLFELAIDHEFARASLGFKLNYTAPTLVS